MPFSVLLLTAASSTRHITGAGGDRVTMKSVRSDELVLFFDKIDSSDPVRQGLNIPLGQQCCDGIIFYTCAERRVICLVEMKSSNLGKAEAQIKKTYQHLYTLLEKECAGCKDSFKQIIWRAYVYRSGSGPQRDDSESCVKSLHSCFGKGNVVVQGNKDITSFLRGEELLGRARAGKKYR